MSPTHSDHTKHPTHFVSATHYIIIIRSAGNKPPSGVFGQNEALQWFEERFQQQCIETRTLRDDLTGQICACQHSKTDPGPHSLICRRIRSHRRHQTFEQPRGKGSSPGAACSTQVRVFKCSRCTWLMICWLQAVLFKIISFAVMG